MDQSQCPVPQLSNQKMDPLYLRLTAKEAQVHPQMLKRRGWTKSQQNDLFLVYR